MGINYKAASDCAVPITLKIISDANLGDESVRLRFLRKPAAAASVRHPNVASVSFWVEPGKYFLYAMEFVEGEDLGISSTLWPG